MTELFTLSDTDLLHNTRHEVPKCVLKNPTNNKLYYVDIRAGGVFEYDPKAGGEPRFINNGSNEFTTALGINEDGSLIVARQSGVYFLKPGNNGAEDKWLKVCDIPGVGEDSRPNNGAMVECADGKTRFFLGTANIRGDDTTPRNALFVLDQKAGGGYELTPISKDFICVNAVSGRTVKDEAKGGSYTELTFADSNAGKSLLHTANYLPNARRLNFFEGLVDFKDPAEGKAIGGRPDGTSPVIYKGRPCVAVAAIDSNEIRIYPVDAKHLNKDEGMLAKITLPEGVVMPTMPTFTTNEDGKTELFVTTLYRNAAGHPDIADERAGKIYHTTLPEDFKAVEYRGSYPDFATMEKAAELVSPERGGRRASA